MLPSALVVMVLMAEPTKDQRDVVLAVTRRIELEGRSSLPDSGLMPEKGPLPLLAQLGFEGPPLASDLLMTPSRWALNPRSAWQAKADAAGKSQYVVEIGLPDVEGDVATVSVGVQLVTQTSFRGVVLCCCTAIDIYRRNARGVWRFEKRDGTVCA